MTSLPKISLPQDVLRLVLEHAAYEDQRTALQLTLVSRTVQYWIDWLLYAKVSLHRYSTTRSFLRTIDTSPTKTPSFFATRVKSLSISFDPHDDSYAARIISACRGVKSLTLWVVSYKNGAYTIYPAVSYTWDSYLPLIRHMSMTAALSYIRPRRLSCRFSNALSTPSPPFHLPFFSEITHLTVANGWEDWTCWFGFDQLPKLTHLAFRLRFGGGMHVFGRNGGVISEYQASTVANFLVELFHRCPRLRVCMFLLSSDPELTKSVRWLLGRMDSAGTDCSCRLVFVDVGTPFWSHEAQSTREEELWRRAEEMAAQRYQNQGGLVCSCWVPFTGTNRI